MTPKEQITNWVKIFNRKDAQGLTEMYHKDAINHQITKDPVEGKESIRKMFEHEFAIADMHCIVENIFEDGDWGILEWKDPLGLRGCGIFHFVDDKIRFQRGYWDKLTFLRMHKLPLPKE